MVRNYHRRVKDEKRVQKALARLHQRTKVLPRETFEQIAPLYQIAPCVILDLAKMSNKKLREWVRDWNERAPERKEVLL